MTRNRYPVAVHLIFMRGGQVLLSRRYQTSWHDGEYSVPAGHVEAGERAQAAAVREAAEEVGVHVDERELELALIMHRTGDPGPAGVRAPEDERIDLFFAVRTWDGEPRNAEPAKCDDLRWCGVDALPPNTVHYIRRALLCMRAGQTYSEFGW